MNVRVRSVIVYAVLSAGLACAGACGRTTPGSPTTPTSLQPGQPTSGGSVGALQSDSQIRSRGGTTTPVLGGTFSAVNDSGDGISGTYAGTVEIGNGFERASLALQVTGGSGGFAGAVGTLTASGFGHFVDEGDFLLGGGGTVTLDSGRQVVVLTVQGSSVVGCSATGRITISQSGDGTLARAGRVTATFRHEVGNAGCTP